MPAIKKVTLTLVGVDGNAFAILAAFRRAAKRQGWTDSEIAAVLDDAKSGDYNHLLGTIMAHCEDDSPDEN